jgi:hypothetical protein
MSSDYVDIRPFNPNKKIKTLIASDTDAIDWMINIPGNNKRVGIWYFVSRFYSTMAALAIILH